MAKPSATLSDPWLAGRSGTSLLAWRWLVLAMVLLTISTIAAWWQDPPPVPADHAQHSFSFWQPMETNAHRRLVSVGNATLDAVIFDEEGRRGWVAGIGTLMSTADGGRTWVQRLPKGASLVNKVRFSDPKHGWIIVDGDKVFVTEDGGKTWQAGLEHQGIIEDMVFAADGKRGWAVGTESAIWTTVNGGRSWQPQASPVPKIHLISLAFAPDGQRGWVVGDKGTILSTDDGGNNWSARPSGTTSRLHAVSFHADGRRGWAAGEDGTILFTANGGASWTRQASNTQAELRALTILSDGQRGWAVGVNGVMTSTRDGGRIWRAYNSGFPLSALNGVHMNNDGLHGWVIGERGIVLLTVDGGRTWLPGCTDAQPTLLDFSFDADADFELAVGRGGTILTSADKGASWTRRSSGVSQVLTASHINEDKRHAWVTGAEGLILASGDRGRTWRQQRSGVKFLLTSITFLEDGQRGWAVGDQGTVLKTTDGGESWSGQVTGTDVLLHDVKFHADGLRGIAVGDSGIVLQTKNGGASWQLLDDAANGNAVLSVHMHADGLRAWLVGKRGTIRATQDGGASWLPFLPIRPTDDDLSDIHFGPDGQNGWAVGANGTILATQDGGRHWHQQPNRTNHELRAVSFLKDDRHGWAMGLGGTILATTDGGRSWHPSEHYSRAPAPWYWLAVLLCGLLIYFSWRLRPAGSAHESVADVGASDAEVRQPADDKLQFAGLARGISRFLRNPETRPPLTLAITGDWGSGKSSLMQLVCTDLRRFGHRPIWFNAWHHQKQEHLFAALLGAIHAQAVPPLASLNGVLFRLRLLWLRSKRHFGVMMFLLGTTALLINLGWHAFQQGSISTLTRAVQGAAAAPDMTAIAKGIAGADSSDAWVGALAGIAGLLTALIGLIKGTKVFGINPALLLTNVHDSMSLKTAAAQNDFRAEFARQFEEVVTALPYRLVIVIDDLDRCRSEAVLDVMEAVNYLTSAGKCFVIFGMARARVQAALGLAFKDIAGELADMEAHASLDGESGNARAKRQAYAADYLHKLINIEINVPTWRHGSAHQLLAEPGPEARRRMAGLLGDVLRLWPLAAAGLAIGCGVLLTQLVPNDFAPGPQATAVKDAAPTSTPSPGATVDAPSEPITPSNTLFIGTLNQVQSGETAGFLTQLGWLGLALLPLLAIGAVILLLLLRKAVLETRDSPRFREALSIWVGAVAERRATPRAVKRFGNRIRYLAMLQQGEARDRTILDALMEAWRGMKPLKWARPDSPPMAEPSQALAEHQLIAIAAFHEIHGASWKEALEEFRSSPRPSDPWAANEPSTPLQDAMIRHQRHFPNSWPPQRTEVEVFETLMSGVRLEGDPVVIDPMLNEAQVSSRQDESSTLGPPAEA